MLYKIIKNKTFKIIYICSVFSNKFIILLVVLVLFCTSLIFINLLTGYENISLCDLFLSEDETKRLIISYRFNKIFAVVLAGISLPVSGFLLQELFKNPLAESSILGISSASALSVSLIIFFGGSYWLLEYPLLSNWMLAIGAFLGALIVSIFLLLTIKKIKNISMFIIIGFLISSFCGSIISMLQFYSQSEKLKQYVFWSFGSFEGLTSMQLIIYALFIVLGLFLALMSVKNLTGFLLGEEYAKVLGVSVISMKACIILSVCFLSGSTTAMLGPIVFIGIIIPHFCRQIWNPASLWNQIILNIWVGVGFMLIVSLVMSYTQLPVNILSSIIGVPTILVMILKTNSKTNFN
ncbi:iron ABC transporter permease [Apibacter muscae]|nr:iron ABC transporter permease [Apibacter muscae]